MRITVAILSACLIGLTVLARAGIGRGDEHTRAHVTILSTTDLHGNIYPLDYNTNAPDARGAATAPPRLRRHDPGHAAHLLPRPAGQRAARPDDGGDERHALRRDD